MKGKNLYCPGQLCLTDEGKKNFERIFGKKKSEGDCSQGIRGKKAKDQKA